MSFRLAVLTVQLSWLPELFPYGLALQGLHVEVVGTSRHDEERDYGHITVIHLDIQESRFKFKPSLKKDSSSL